jgi:ABC-type transport system involved in cytochrome bd biosynthesis fused ATPase/permease subunit
VLERERLDIEHRAERIDRLERQRAHLRMFGAAVVAAAPLLTATACLATIAATATSLSGPVIGVLVLWPLAIMELVGTVNESAATVPSITASSQRVFAVLDTPDPTSEPTRLRPIATRPSLTLDAVTARWPNSETDALTAVSMHLEPGEFVTITGPSGSGKSTLAAVLVGFLTPATGTCRLGDVPLHDATGDAVRRRVTWIQQVPWIADSTVRENLRLADPDATDDDLRDALRAVSLDQWLDRLAAGLDSQLGRGGSRMSGGEAQRLALARVLLAGHDVVVLDEPTANLDADTAAHVLDTVLERCDGRSTILLGHHD